MEPLLGLWAINLLIGIVIARSRGLSAFGGCLWALLLGPIGWIAIALWPSRRRRPCPHCREMIIERATVCPFCQRDVAPVTR